MNSDYSPSIAILLMAFLTAYCLGFANLFIVPEAVASPMYRIALAALSISVVTGLTVFGIILGYAKSDGEAIPWLERLGIALIIVSITAGMIAVVTACIGVMSKKRA